MLTHEWMTPHQAAQYLQVSEATITRWIRTKKMPASKIGGRYRIAAVDLERMLEEGRR